MTLQQKSFVKSIGGMCLFMAGLFVFSGYGENDTHLLHGRSIAVTDEDDAKNTKKLGVECSQLAIAPAPMLKEDEWDDVFESANGDESAFDYRFNVGFDSSLNLLSQITRRIVHEKDKFRLMAMDLAATRERLGAEANLIGIDIGANRGVWSYGMASHGLEVHSFEILPENFKLIQHGKRFNSPQINRLVNLYPMGMADDVAFFNFEGQNEAGHLVPSPSGDILGLTFDCFAQQTEIDLSRIAFVKVDAEGFDIRFLRGAHNSLFRDDVQIPSFVMELNPKAWKRNGNTPFEEAIDELKIIMTKFKHAYMIPNPFTFSTSRRTFYTKNLMTKEPLTIGDTGLWKLNDPDEIAIALMNGKQDGDLWLTNADSWAIPVTL